MARSGNITSFSWSLGNFNVISERISLLSGYSVGSVTSIDSGSLERRYFVVSHATEPYELIFGVGESGLPAKGLYAVGQVNAGALYDGDDLGNENGLMSVIYSPTGGLTAALASHDPLSPGFFTYLDANNPGYMLPAIVPYFQDDSEVYDHIFVTGLNNELVYLNCEGPSFRTYSGFIFSKNLHLPARAESSLGYGSTPRAGIASFYHISAVNYTNNVKLVCYIQKSDGTNIGCPAKGYNFNSQNLHWISKLTGTASQNINEDAEGDLLQYEIPLFDSDEEFAGVLNTDIIVGTANMNDDSLDYSIFVGSNGEEKIYLVRHLAVPAYSGLVLLNP